MNFEVNLSIDGKILAINDELQNLLQNLVGSYIAQNFLLGKKGKLKSPKIPKDPNVLKRERRFGWTDEDLQGLKIRVSELRKNDLSYGKIAKILVPEFNRTEASIRTKISIFQRESTNL